MEVVLPQEGKTRLKSWTKVEKEEFMAFARKKVASWEAAKRKRGSCPSFAYSGILWYAELGRLGNRYLRIGN